MNNFNGGRTCATCKHFRSGGGQFSECHLEPMQTVPLLLGVGPPSTGAPNGTPIIHLDVRYRITRPDCDCSHWAVRIERAVSIEDLPMLGQAQ